MEPELLDGRYELVAPVGKGATGQVWRGFDRLLQRAVAIKLVDLESSRDPATAERFRREGVAIAGLSHDTIVRIFDTGTDEHRGWLVMELLTGPDLNALVKSTGPQPYEVGMPLLARVATGLQAAHDAGITHRDVKPANIVLDTPGAADGSHPDLMAHPELGRPVLVDFGIARIVDEAGAQLTRPATAIGTAAYMSPEQARGFAVGPASDVYSLGCVAYHLFTGRPPFVADSSVAVARAQAFDTPVPLAELSPDAPPALAALVARMLAKAPEARPSAREVAAELRAITANPLLAPTVMPEAATQLMGGAEPTMVMDAPTELASEPVPAPRPVPVAAPPRTPAPTPAPLPPPPAAAPSQNGGGFRNAGRWLVALLIVGLGIGLAYSWFSREPAPPVPSETVTMTTTQTPTSAPPTRQTPTSQPPSTPPPTSATQPPAPTTTEPSVPQPPTTAPPATTEPPTSAEPPATTANPPAETTGA